jgi:RNA polymerase sigma-70 factor (ECF subfamily)
MASARLCYAPCVGNEPSDEELARAVIAGGAGGATEAERMLCARFARRVRLFGCRHLRQPADVDDLVQDVLLTTIGALRAGEVTRPEHLASYILGVSHNKVREARRRLARAQTHLAHDQSLEHVVALTREPPSVRASRLEDCMGNLPQRERALIQRTFCDGERAPEIGAALGMTADHVRVARQRALRALRACLEHSTIVMAR